MKLAYSPASPFARKIRIAAMELGLFDKIEFIVPIKAIPVTENEEYARNVSPLRKIPALILDSGQVIVDSYVIAEYLDELGGGKLIPASGPAKWQVKTDHSIRACSMRCCCAATRECCGRRNFSGPDGRTISSSAHGMVWRATRRIPTC